MNMHAEILMLLCIILCVGCRNDNIYSSGPSLGSRAIERLDHANNEQSQSSAGSAIALIIRGRNCTDTPPVERLASHGVVETQPIRPIGGLRYEVFSNACGCSVWIVADGGIRDSQLWYGPISSDEPGILDLLLLLKESSATH